MLLKTRIKGLFVLPIEILLPNAQQLWQLKVYSEQAFPLPGLSQCRCLKFNWKDFLCLHVFFHPVNLEPFVFFGICCLWIYNLHDCFVTCQAPGIPLKMVKPDKPHQVQHLAKANLSTHFPNVNMHIFAGVLASAKQPTVLTIKTHNQ